jgi:hypothetical protein
MNKMYSKDYYKQRIIIVLNSIEAHKINYRLSDFDLDASGIDLNQYRGERLKLCGIKDETERGRQSALLKVRFLKKHLTSLTGILMGIGGQNAN